MHTVAVLAGCKKSALAGPICSTNCIETSVLVGASVLAGGAKGVFVPFGIGKHYVKCGNKTSDAPLPPPPKLFNHQLLSPLDNFSK